MPGTASSPRRQSANAPTPGSTTRVGLANFVGIARHDDRLIVPAFARSAFERLRRRMQIARPVVDDRNAHGRAAIMAAIVAQGTDPMTSGAGSGIRMDWRRRGSGRRRRRRVRRPRLEETTLGSFLVRRDHQPNIGPAAAQAPAPQRAGFASDQNRNQDSDGELHRARYAKRPERDLDRRRAGEIDHQHQPQPMPQHPQRAEQERPDVKSVAHECEALGRRRLLVLARRRLVDGKNCHLVLRRKPVGQPQLVSRPACLWSKAPRRRRADRSQMPRAAPAPGP